MADEIVSRGRGRPSAKSTKFVRSCSFRPRWKRCSNAPRLPAVRIASSECGIIWGADAAPGSHWPHDEHQPGRFDRWLGAAALKFSRRDSQNWIGRTLNFAASLRGAASTSYAQHAIAEADFRNRRARHIVYGHTHCAETVPLEASPCRRLRAESNLLQRGCCRRSYQPMQMFTGSHEWPPATPSRCSASIKATNAAADPRKPGPARWPR